VNTVQATNKQRMSVQRTKVIILIYLLIAIGLSPGGRSVVHNFSSPAPSTFDIFVYCNWVGTRWQQYSTHLHTNNIQNNTKQTIHRTAQQIWKSVGCAPSWLVLPWHLPYNQGKSTEKPQSG